MSWLRGHGLRFPPRCSVVLAYLYTGHFALQGAVYAQRGIAFDEVVTLDLADGPCHIAFLHRAVADDHYVVERVGVVGHFNVYDLLGENFHRLAGLAHIGESQHIAFLGVDRIGALVVGGGRRRGAFDHNGHADQRRTVVGVGNHARNVHLLSQSRACTHQTADQE